MKIIIDCKDFNDWYLEQIISKLKEVVGSRRIKLEEEE